MIDSLEHLLELHQKSHGVDSTTIALLCRLSEVSTSVSAEKSQSYTARAVEYLQTHYNKSCEAYIFYNRGVHALMNQDLATADSLLKRGFELAKQQSNRPLQIRIYSVLVGLEDVHANFAKSVEYCHQALSLAESLGDSSLLCLAYIIYGNEYVRSGMMEVGKPYLNRGLALAEKLRASDMLLNALGGLANLTMSPADSLVNQQYYKRIVQLCEQEGWKSMLGAAIQNRGWTLLNQGRFQEAADHFQRSLEIAESMNFSGQIMYETTGLALAFLELKRYEEALKNAQRGLVLSKESGSKFQVYLNLSVISAYYRARKDFEKALVYMDTVRLYQDSIFNTEQTQKISALQFNAQEQRKNLELQKIQAENERSAILRNSFAGGFVVILGAAAWLLVLYRRQRHAKSVIQHKSAELEEKNSQLEIQRARSDDLLLNILPESIAKRLKDGETAIADHYENVSILFADIVGFTPLAARQSPRQMVVWLNDLYTRFDRAARNCGVERVKTIGDAYMCVAGVPEHCTDHAQRIVRFALAIREEARMFSQEVGEQFDLRIGIDSGEVVGAVVGEAKFSYDLWGDTVNTAARMESHGERGKIHLSEAVIRALGQTAKQDFRVESRGELEIKGKGMMRTFFLERV